MRIFRLNVAYTCDLEMSIQAYNIEKVNANFLVTLNENCHLTSLQLLPISITIYSSSCVTVFIASFYDYF